MASSGQEEWAREKPNPQHLALGLPTRAEGLLFKPAGMWYAVLCYGGEGNDNPLQYSCLENSIDRRACEATVHGVTKGGHDWATNHNSVMLVLAN